MNAGEDSGTETMEAASSKGNGELEKLSEDSKSLDAAINDDSEEPVPPDEAASNESNEQLEKLQMKDVALSEATSNESKAKVETLQKEVEKLKEELNEAKSQVTIARCTKENELEIERRKHREEMASNEHFIKVRGKEEMMELRYHYESIIKKMKKPSEQPIEKHTPQHGVLSTMTKTIAKRVGSLAQPCDSENLEHSMKKAQEDTAFLKSIIDPLEEEIRVLKDKLRETDNQLQLYSKVQSDLVKGTEQLAGFLLTGAVSQEVLTKSRELQIEVSENASLSDLQTLAAILNTQKVVFQEENDRLKSTNRELITSMEKERKSYHKVNDDYAELQKEYVRVSNMLTPEQKRHLEEMIQKESLEAARSISPSVHTPREARLQSIHIRSEESGGTPHEASLLSVEATAGDSVSVDSLTGSGFALGGGDSVSVDTHSVSEDSSSLLDGESLERSGLGNRVQARADASPDTEEARRSRDSRSCHMCANYETQLQKAEADLSEALKTKGSLEKSLESSKQDLRRESRYREDLEKEWSEVAKDYEKQVTELYRNMDEKETALKTVKSTFRSFCNDVSIQVSKLSAERGQVEKELAKLQHENDSLIGKYSTYAEQYQNDVINLPINIEEAHHHLLKLRDELIHSKVAKQHLEENLQSENEILREELHSARTSKEQMVSQLRQELSTLLEEMEIRKSCQSQLEVEERSNKELRSENQKLKQNMSITQGQHEQLVQSLTGQVKEKTQLWTQIKTEAQQLKDKISSLQHDLDNSEKTQKDFVRLSQSLQMQLEEIRESEQEVRWQHEEDVEQCNSCRQNFTVTKRKHHCRHCGRIFCSDCTSKTVYSGPSRRQSKVCDVCHTLLEKHSAPYFSTEPPNTPD